MWGVNWWPHGNLHRIVGFRWEDLIKIEYGFHVTLVVAGAIVTLFFVGVLQAGRPAAAIR
jgi:hypothetical protein